LIGSVSILIRNCLCRLPSRDRVPAVGEDLGSDGVIRDVVGWTRDLVAFVGWRGVRLADRQRNGTRTVRVPIETLIGVDAWRRRDWGLHVSDGAPRRLVPAAVSKC
jgi:hypothetical protein